MMMNGSVEMMEYYYRKRLLSWWKMAKGLWARASFCWSFPFEASVTLTWIRRPPRDPIGQCFLQLLYLRILLCKAAAHSQQTSPL